MKGSVFIFFILAAYDLQCEAQVDWSKIKINSDDVAVQNTGKYVPSPRIINGQKATLGQIPWLVGIIGDQSALCGGSLISDTWVLTAAHCVRSITEFIIYLGTVSLTGDNTDVQITTTKIPHPQFTSETHQYDLALLRLQAPTQINDYVQAILLPRGFDFSFENYTAIIGGWGTTTEDKNTPSIDTLMYVVLPVISNAQCSDVYGSKIVTDSILCTLGTNSKSTCSGDSGGPLAVGMSDGSHMQIGLVSFGAKDHCAGYPTGYTRLTSHVDWILEQTGI